MDANDLGLLLLIALYLLPSPIFILFVAKAKFSRSLMKLTVIFLVLTAPLFWSFLAIFGDQHFESPGLAWLLAMTTFGLNLVALAVIAFVRIFFRKRHLK